ncbi:hypothetical protein CWI36_0078p0030 [Hamiltosporidium magnivora]|uniref:Uncharacterized protein n=1 Tax=Hamiltosporidium magnivora TaxID=148818 RepID=A0A4Q9LKZ0_9MICR|nr:hypothetical protein CWI36_0078p0030 [Hamiltosporidium magnivora]
MRLINLILCTTSSWKHKYSLLRILIVFPSMIAVTKVIFLFSEEDHDFDSLKVNSLTNENCSVGKKHEKDTMKERQNKKFTPKESYNIFVVENIEKYPIILEIITEKINKTQSDIVIVLKNTKYSEFKIFDNFLKTCYLPQETFSINHFVLILYFLDSLKVVFNINFTKIINYLFYNLNIFCKNEMNIQMKFWIDFLVSNEDSLNFFNMVFGIYLAYLNFNNAYILNDYINFESYLSFETYDFLLTNKKYRILKIDETFLNIILARETENFFIIVFLALFNAEVIFIEKYDLLDAKSLDKCLFMITNSVDAIVFYDISIEDSVISFINSNNISKKITYLYFYCYSFTEITDILNNSLGIKKVFLVDWLKNHNLQYLSSESSESIDKLKLLINEKSLNIEIIEKNFQRIPNKNEVKYLSIRYTNAKIENLCTLKNHVIMNIKSLKIFQSEVTFEALINIDDFPYIKELELNKVEIIQIIENFEINQNNQSLLNLKIIAPKISIKTKIYDFIHCFNKLESLNLYLDEDLIGKEKCSTVLFRSAKDLNLLTFVCTKVTIMAITELSYFKNTKKIEFREIKQLDFYETDRFCFNFMHLENIEFEKCKFKDIEFNQLFYRVKEYNIKSISLIDCSLTDMDIIFIFELKSLTFFNIYGFYLKNSSILRFKRNNFLALKLFNISLSCDKKSNSNLAILNEEFSSIL